MSERMKYFYVILICLIIVNNCYAEKISSAHITIKTSSKGMTFKQIHKEIELQSGIKTLVDRPYKSINFQEISLEVNLINLDVFEAFKTIEKQVQIKYDPKFIIRNQFVQKAIENELNSRTI